MPHAHTHTDTVGPHTPLIVRKTVHFFFSCCTLKMTHSLCTGACESGRSCASSAQKPSTSKMDWQWGCCSSCCQILHCAHAMDRAWKGPRQISPGPVCTSLRGPGSGCGRFSPGTGTPAFAAVPAPGLAGGSANALTSAQSISSWLISAQDSCIKHSFCLYQSTSS